MATKAIILLACALLVSAQIDLTNKNVLYGDGVDRHVNIEEATKGKLPAFSLNKDAVTNSRCAGGSACGSIGDAQSSFTQIFADGLGTTICLCTGYTMGAAEVARKFAHVPAGLRSSVNLLSAKAAGDGAYAFNNAVSFLGTYSANTFVSQAAQVFDTANKVTTTNAFIQALTKDACVVDGSSQQGPSYAWASTVLLWSYFQLTNVTKAKAANVACWANQKNVAEALLPVETIPQAFFNNVYEVIPRFAKMNALGVAKDNMTLTTARATERKWTFLRASGKSFLICDTTSRTCVDAYGRTGNGESPILFNRRNGGVNQRWNIVAANGAYTFQNEANGLFLDVASCGKFSNSTNAVMSVQASNDCQKWIVREYKAPVPTRPSTFTRSHSVSYTETVKPTQSFTESDITHTKSHTATISTNQVETFSRPVTVDVPSTTVKETKSVSFRPTSGNNATKTRSESSTRSVAGFTKTVADVQTQTVPKTKTATVSKPDSTYTTKSHSHSATRTTGTSHSVSRTKSAGPSSSTHPSTVSHSVSYSEAVRSTQTFTETDNGVHPKTESKTGTSKASESVSASQSFTLPSRTIKHTASETFKPAGNGTVTDRRIITKSAIDFNQTLPHTRAVTSSRASANHTRTVTESKAGSTYTSASHSHTGTRTVSSHTVSKTRSAGPTASATASQTVTATRTFKPSGASRTATQTFAERRTFTKQA